MFVLILTPSYKSFYFQPLLYFNAAKVEKKVPESSKKYLTTI